MAETRNLVVARDIACQIKSNILARSAAATFDHSKMQKKVFGASKRKEKREKKPFCVSDAGSTKNESCFWKETIFLKLQFSI